MKELTTARKYSRTCLVMAVFAALVASILFMANLLQRWDNLVYDLELRIFARPANPEIVIVAIDENSLQQLGRWPWSRNIHAQLLNRLSAAEVKAVGMDILFMEPERGHPDADMQLAESLQVNGRVVLPVLLEMGHANAAIQLLEPLPQLARAAALLSHVNVNMDGAGEVRSITLNIAYDSRNIPAFSLAMLQVAKPDWHTANSAFADTGANLASVASGAGLNKNRLLIPFAGPVGHFHRVSYVDVLRNAAIGSSLRDKFVLVGITAAGLAQKFATPVSKQNALMTGIELNANVLDALLAGIIISPVAQPWGMLLTFLLVFLPVLVFNLLTPRYALLITVTFVLLAFFSSMVLLEFTHLWYRPVSATLVILISYGLWSWRRLEVFAGTLFTEKEKASATLHAVGDAVIATDVKGLVDYMNPVAEKMTGYALEQVQGKLFAAIISVENSSLRTEFNALFKAILQGRTVDKTETHILVNRFCREYVVRLVAKPIVGTSGKVSGMIFAFSDISEIHEISRKMSYQATHDPLTDLPNRLLLRDRLGKGIKTARRFCTNLAVLFVDLDHFKKINDGLGHGKGDLLLKQVAARLRGGIREMDTTARWGGDEFVILLENLIDEYVVAEIAAKFLNMLSSPYTIEGQQFFLTCSIGISLYPKDGADADVLLARADSAMHRVKESGGDNFSFYSLGLNERARERLIMEKEIHDALDDQQFEVFYQPQVKLENGQIVGAEALLRWRHPEKGIIPPDDFIYLAEDVGLIIPIGEELINTVCRQIRSWLDEGLPTINVAVNLSPRQFMQKDLIEKINQAMESNRIESKMLHIEITESLMIRDINRVSEILHALKASGISVAIDDFGTGYSSLDFLKRFPIDILKIDKSFVSNIFDNTDDASIVDAVIALGHNMCMQIIAEGIETEQQLLFLKQRQCDIGQGFYFSKPLSTEHMTALLRDSTQGL